MEVVMNSDDVESETPGSPNGKANGWFEGITGITALVGVACYAQGLVIVNGYLFRLGISDFSAARIQFVYTGATFLIPVFLNYWSMALLFPT